MDDTMYALIQWEDLFTSIINTKSILTPKKDPFCYIEGEEITRHYQSKVYHAVICETHPNKKYLENQMKMGKLKHTWYQIQNQKCTGTKQTDTVFVEKSTCKGFEAITNTGTKDISSSSSQGSLKSDDLHAAQGTPTSGTSDIHSTSKGSLKPNDHDAVKGKEPHHFAESDDAAAAGFSSPLKKIRLEQSASDKWTTDCLISEVRRLKKRVSALEQRDEKNKQRTSSLDEKSNKNSKVSESCYSESSPEVDISKLKELIADSLCSSKATTVLLHYLFTNDEIINSSVTGKYSAKCTGNVRPPLEPAKLQKLISCLQGKFGSTRKEIVEKIQNVQKVQRRKAQVCQDSSS